MGLRAFAKISSGLVLFVMVGLFCGRATFRSGPSVELGVDTPLLFVRRVFHLLETMRRILRPRTLFTVPIAIISILAAGTTAAVAANISPASASLPAVTAAVAFAPQAPVNLGSAGSFAVLSKSGVTNVYASAITGDVGASPITGAAIDLTCTEVSGTIFSVDAAGPLPCAVTDATGLTAAVSDEETAYTDAAGRTNPDVVDLGAGEIGGLTLAPGLYKWGTDVSISNDVTLSGGPNDVWIFQIAGTLNQASAKNVTLAGGAQAKNVFWQAAGAVTIGTTAHFEGTILSQTMIAMNTGATTNGRLLAQTAVTLQMNTITLPEPAVAPVEPPVVAPVEPPVVAPVEPPAVAPVEPPVVAPVEPPVVAPVEPPVVAPVEPPVVAPVEPPVVAPVEPPVVAPVEPPVVAPVEPPVVAPVEPPAVL
jgi:hypothetical protein